MASTSHILLGNHAVNHTKELTPVSALGHGPDPHLRNLGPVAYDGRTLETTCGGCILEYTYLEGLVPSLVATHGQVSRLRNQRTMAHDKLS